MKRSLSKGRVISYYDSGKGSPLVFLHSFGHMKLMWFPQLNFFANRGFRVIAPDYSGHGESSLDTTRTYSIDGLVEDVATFVSDMSLDKATFVGISMGGYVALGLWEKHSDLIGSLVLSNTKAEADTEEIKARRRAQIQFLREHSLQEFVETNAQRRLSRKTIEERPWVLDFVKTLNLSVKPEVLIASLEAIAQKRDNTNLLSSVSVPTLITAGSDDIHIPKSSAPLMNRGIKGSKLVYIDGTAHVSNLENPQQYNETIYEFLNKQG